MELTERGNLPVLGRRTTQDEESTNSNIFDHYESPCDFAVSNDPLVGDQDACSTRLVGCVRDHEFLSGTREQTTEMRLQYEYDLYYKSEGSDYDFYDILDFVEGAILNHLASPAVLDKAQCSYRYDERRRDLKRYLQFFDDDIKKSIVAISSEKTDTQNKESECQTPPAEGIACQPMSGHTTVYFERARLDATEEQQLMQGVLKAIEAGMASDTYVKGDVQRLVYISSTRDGPTEKPVNPLTLSQEQDPEHQGAGGKLGTTEISLVSTAAFLFIIIALVGLLVIPKRRRKGQCGGETPIPVTDNEFDVDEETAASVGARSWHNPAIGQVPTPLTRQQSLQSVEGSEIPGSLAAADALALKPQFPRHVSGGNSVSAGKPPHQPPTPCHMHRDNISVSAALETIGTRDSPSAAFTDDQSFTTSGASNKPTLRLSPIQNQNSGVSPSQVSPNRSGRIRTTTTSSSSEDDEHSSVEQMVAEIESGVPLGTYKTPRRGGHDIETLNRIVASGSESDTSFRDSESGAVPHRHSSKRWISLNLR